MMARSGKLSDEYQEHLDIIIRSGEYLLDLINDVLQMSRIEAGQIQFNPQNFDFHRMLRDLETMLQMQIKGKGIALEFRYSEDIPKYIRTDEAKLRQILLNLLANAIKFTSSGFVSLTIEAEQTNNDLILGFAVEDSGAGIADDELDRLFTPFAQTSSGKQLSSGSGLGLVISYRFAQLLGGDIQVQSEIGVGSHFQVRLRAEVVSADEVETVRPKRTVIGVAPNQDMSAKIMVVEDHEPNRNLMRQFLRPLGFEVCIAENGLEGVDLFKSYHPDLVFMDLKMPMMNGYEATRRIRRDEAGGTTKIIAFTAGAFQEEYDTAIRAGCDDILVKPVRLEDVCLKLTEHLGIEFIYEEETAQMSASESKDIEGLRADFLALPHTLREDFRYAVIAADLDRILSLIPQIGDQSHALAERLENYVADYRFDQLNDLLNTQGGDSNV